MIAVLGKLYYQACIKIFVTHLKKHTEVKQIILNGSVANEICNYFISDIDISIILKANSSVEDFNKLYKKKLYLFSLLCPYLLPISERLQNVYNEDELSSEFPHTYRGFLKNTPYKVLYGEELKVLDQKIDDVLFIENKIYHLLSAKNIRDDKVEKLKEMVREYTFDTPLESAVLNRVSVFKNYVDQFLNLPYLAGKNIHVYQYDSFESFIYETNIKYRYNQDIKTIHYFAPFLAIVNKDIKIYYQERLPEEILGRVTTLNDKTAFYQQDIESLNYYYLNNFKKYIPFFTNDLLSKKNLVAIANYLKLYQKGDENEIIDLIEALEVVLGKRNEVKQTLCICTKDRKESLLDLFESINKQTKAPDEILIINNGESWNEAYINRLKGLANCEVNIYESSLSTISALRNFAISKSKYELISFVDDDCILVPQWLERVREHFEVDPDLKLLGGAVVHYRGPELNTSELFHRAYLEARN